MRPLPETTSDEISNASNDRSNPLPAGLPVNVENDADLMAIVDAWPHLPTDVRKMIRGVVRATMGAAKSRR
jgi:hypothetical protein